MDIYVIAPKAFGIDIWCKITYVGTIQNCFPKNTKTSFKLLFKMLMSINGWY
jgi:hypothetical protein